MSAVVCEPWTGLVELRPAPALVAASHGTSSAAGQAAISAVVEEIARRRPDLQVSAAFVDVQQPDVPTSLEALSGQARVVPLLLSSGYHVHVDLARAADARAATTVSAALGPDLRLTEVLARRLREAGVRSGDAIVLGCAGSSDARAVADCETTAAQLAALLGQPVRAGYISAAAPDLATAVAAARRELAGADPAGRVVVASYLLAPGYFASLAAGCGADVVTEPLLAPGHVPPPAVVDVVLDRFSAP
ncbi:sirohydrochlorin chelatase [Arthrobacter castelli]|uniref:sirohydrochlorin chelatase n=1 Tax=Arthrobacter castelli TaxID=271431 RepID=UPI000406AA7D|nr:CbiX/SirB N-terminal domain-containing protein [Arthrobacter castelli]